MLKINRKLVPTQYDYYSSDEIKTNKIWIDGKPIYRKVVSVPVQNLVGNTTLLVAHGISDLKFVTQAYGAFSRGNGVTLNIVPCTYTNWEIYLYDFGITYFSVRASSNQVNGNITAMFIVIEYTKTTD